jgi:hypothetical protein
MQIFSPEAAWHTAALVRVCEANNVHVKMPVCIDLKKTIARMLDWEEMDAVRWCMHVARKSKVES